MTDKQFEVYLTQKRDIIDKIYDNLRDKLDPIIGIDDKNMFGQPIRIVKELTPLSRVVDQLDKEINILKDRS